MGWKAGGGEDQSGGEQGRVTTRTKKHASLGVSRHMLRLGRLHRGALPRDPIPSSAGSRLATAAACLPAHFFFPPGPPLSFRLSIWPCGPGPQLPMGCLPGPFVCQAVSFWMVLL